MTITVTIRAILNNPRDEAFLAFLEENLPNVRGFSGARSVELFLNETTGHFCLHEVWQSQEHHQAYLKAIQETGVLGELAEFFRIDPEITYYRKLDL